MTDVKINASIILPGRVLPAEPRLLKKAKKKKKRKKEEEKKENEILYRQETIRLEKSKPIVINLREPKPVQQVLHLSEEAYNTMISPENPVNGVKLFEWKKLSTNKRVKLHLQAIAENLGGKLDAFKILED